ncbi:hypothetical protein CC80DRAFT_543755 [Byssothecium circinans]|uniref:Uncharacterized protein n=1 Tax=Byssothecium circinans TaxID=147558 RepID=A0A6A5U909_9PLEO|nr:hypothetical protein CC80DRAFT_543755 [Byssothecium circinans]
MTGITCLRAVATPTARNQLFLSPPYYGLLDTLHSANKIDKNKARETHETWDDEFQYGCSSSQGELADYDPVVYRIANRAAFTAVIKRTPFTRTLWSDLELCQQVYNPVTKTQYKIGDTVYVLPDSGYVLIVDIRQEMDEEERKDVTGLFFLAVWYYKTIVSSHAQVLELESLGPKFTKGNDKMQIYDVHDKVHRNLPAIPDEDCFIAKALKLNKHHPYFGSVEE